MAPFLDSRWYTSTNVAALYAAAGGAPATTPAQDLVDTWASGGAGSDGFAMVFEDAGGTDAPSIYVKDSGTPANDTDINLTDDFDTFNSFLTYTSPSPKIVRQSDGNLKYCAHNLYLNSASPANQSITVVSGQSYAVTITGSVSVTASGAATGTWTAGTNTFTAATTTLTLGSTSGSGTVHVYRTPADTTYLATTGSIRYALPIQHDSSNNAEGLLVEPAATNLMPYSKPNVGSGEWTAFSATATANNVASPSGETTGTTITAMSGATTHHIYDTFSVSASVSSFTYSIYAKAGTTNFFNFRVLGGLPGLDAHYILNLSTGAVTQTIAAGDSTPTFEDVGNGWWRIALYDTSNGTAGTPTFYIGPHDGSASDSWTASGTETVHVWHAQVELGSVPTSHIITTGATATRAVDQLQKSISATPIDITTATSYYVKQYLFAGTVNVGIVGVHNDVSNRFSSRYENTASRTFAGSTGTVSAYGSATRPGVNKFAASQNTNDLAVSMNGATVGTDTSVALAVSNGSNIDLYQGPTPQPDSLIKEILWLPEDMSNTDLESITT